MKRKHKPSLAERIADSLLTNEFGETGTRLIIDHPSKSDMGGWCRNAIIREINIAIRKDENQNEFRSKS